MMNKYPPECPFCGRYIVRPETTRTEFGEVLSGKCNCGAVYVCDPTGHNTGEAYMEALAMAKGDWDIGLMGEDLDYQGEDMDYDLKSHRRLYSAGMGEARGKLVFVKLKKIDAAQTHSIETAYPQPNNDINSKSIAEAEQMSEKGDLKGRIKNFLKTRSYNEIAEIAKRDKGVIRRIISLAYDKDDVISWRAMEAMGIIAGELSKERLDVIRDTIRRLLWSMGEESGGIGWSAAEMLGEIIRNNPDEFSNIIPIVWSFRDEEMFRAGTVWAMGRIAAVRPDLVGFISKDLRPMMTDNDPAVRGYAAWVVGVLRDRSTLGAINKLVNDGSTINVYQDGELIKRTVGEIVKEAINRIGDSQE
jgi:hypothetical protein